MMTDASTVTRRHGRMADDRRTAMHRLSTSPDRGCGGARARRRRPRRPRHRRVAGSGPAGARRGVRRPPDDRCVVVGIPVALLREGRGLRLAVAALVVLTFLRFGGEWLSVPDGTSASHAGPVARSDLEPGARGRAPRDDGRVPPLDLGRRRRAPGADPGACRRRSPADPASRGTTRTSRCIRAIGRPGARTPEPLPSLGRRRRGRPVTAVRDGRTPSAVCASRTSIRSTTRSPRSRGPSTTAESADRPGHRARAIREEIVAQANERPRHRARRHQHGAHRARVRLVHGRSPGRACRGRDRTGLDLPAGRARAAGDRAHPDRRRPDGSRACVPWPKPRSCPTARRPLRGHGIGRCRSVALEDLGHEGLIRDRRPDVALVRLRGGSSMSARASGPRTGSSSGGGVMQFSRARFLSSALTTYQGACLMSVCANMSSLAFE